MKLMNHERMRASGWLGLLLIELCLMGLGMLAHAQAVSTTTVQGTVYLANGQPGTGTLIVSWPSFTTASGQLVAADSTTAAIAPDGFVSVSLAPNLGATPAGEYYTAVFYMSDGSVNTQYWVVPAATSATLAQVQAQLMPATQAVQAVSKAYVDQSIANLAGGVLTVTGATLTGPLTLCCDPTTPLQAADKHYVDESFALAVPLAGGSMTGALTAPAVNGVQSPAAGSAQTTLQAAVTAAGSTGAVEIPPNYAGTDAFTNLNGVYVADLRRGVSQQYARSVKEFGAVCDGSTDDTNALQEALNYAETHGVALTIPQGTCKTRTLVWHGESIGGMGKQVSALMGFPGQDVLVSMADSTIILSYTRIHDLTIYVDQSADVSCSAAKGLAPAGSCAQNRPLESNSIFSPGGNGLSGTLGTGTAWAVGNCAIAMPAATGLGGNGLKVAEIENLEIAATGVDPMAAQYPGAHSTHTCGLYLGQWPQWSEFRNIDIRGLNTGIAIPALPVTAPAGLNSDSNRWQNITIQATHGFTAAAGSNNVLDNVVSSVGNSAATGEPPTGLVLDLSGTQQGWTVRNPVVLPAWNAVQPTLTVAATGGAVTSVAVGSQAGLGFDPYGSTVPLAFSGSCTAQAVGNVNSSGAIGSVTVTSGGVGCSSTTTASVNVAGTWDTAAPVNLIAGQNMTFYGGNLLKGNGGYTVWNAAGSESYGTQLDGGGGRSPSGGTYAALVTNSPIGRAYPVDQFPGADFGAKLQACLGSLSASNGGTCDARNFTGTLSMGSSLTISTANATVQLPCATITTANQVIVTAGTRNVSLRGCALRGASTASGSLGGTVFYYSGTGAMVQVGDPTYAADTMGFHLDNVVINTTASSSATAKGLVAYRTQELDLESLYFLGNSNQTGMTLDGTGNYTGGTFFDNEFTGFQTAVNAIGHQITNPATTDWMNASTFVRVHIDCPTSGGSPISGTYGINLQQGDGNTFTGGDVEGCSTALHLGANAQNNTIVGLRNENSTNQVVADAGSSYNNWMTGGTMFTGQLTDNGTRNSFLDTFHRSFNGLNGDWYGSQKDATLTNHYRLGIGAGNERGLLNEIQTDYGYRWLEGYTDATTGEQFYQIQDLLNNVNRLSIGQYNNGQSSTNNQTVVNSAGTGAVVLNGSNNAGTGGVVIGSGGASETTVATISNAGNAQFNGTLQVGGTSTLIGTPTVKNQADTEIDATLWAGLTTSQKESFIYKDWNGNSQWYMEKDASNNWELNSATGGLDSFKAYQSTNSGDTYVDTSNSTGVVRINYETGSGTQFKVYGGNSSTLYAAFTGTTSIQFPGLAASSGHNCLQVDNSGYVTNTGTACGSGSSTGTVNSGSSGQIAYYNGTGTVLSGTSTVSVTAGGTGSSTASGALTNLGGAALAGAAFSGPVSISSTFSVANNLSIGPRYDVTNAAFGAKGDGATDDTLAIQAAFNACANYVASTKTLTGNYGGIVEFPGIHSYVVSSTINAYDGCHVEGTVGSSSGGYSPPKILWNGTTAGTVYTITGFTAAANTTPLYTLSSPAPYAQGNLATFTVSGGSVPTVGQWVDIEGLSTSAGKDLNRVIAQVAAASGSTFTVVFPSGIIAGTFTDSGTATTVNVVIAFDANARYETAISNMVLTSLSTLTSFQVGFYYGSRVDTGTHMEHTDVGGSTMYSYYFSAGGINVDFDKGWRSDGALIAGIYWRVAGDDDFGIANGTTDNSSSTATSGAAVMLDNSACGTGGDVRITARNIKHEINTNMTPGLGVYTLLDCPADGNGEQFFLNFDSVWMAPGSVTNAPGIVMSPANDAALVLGIVSSTISGGGSLGGKWVGLPTLTRNDLGGVSGWTPLISYSPPFISAPGGTGYSNAAAPTQLLSDLNVAQLYQYGIGASDFLYADTAYAALPNGTTLFAGQILAPPSYWSGANGKRYALDVVYQTGTTGTPNGGATSCSGASGTGVLTCSSATDLSTGQRITIGTDTNMMIRYVDATNPSAVLVNLTSTLGASHSSQALTFSAPVLGPEIQMPTKSSSAPSTLAWSQGDMEQNSAATANGVAAWVNVAAGTPGTWAGIPLGNSSGQIAASQIASTSLQGTDAKVLTAGTVTGTASTLCTDANGGATTTGCSLGAVVTNTPAWLMNLGTGADGSYEFSSTGSCTTSPAHCYTGCTSSAPCGQLRYVGDMYTTSFQIDSGAYVYTDYASSYGLVVHATSACNIYGTILANGTYNILGVGGTGIGGGSSGSSGGGTAAGSAGIASNGAPSNSFIRAYAVAAGAASGGNGVNGNPFSANQQRFLLNLVGAVDGMYLTGSGGVQGANSGGAGSEPGSGFVAMCGSINGSGGVIDASGANGGPAAANSTGAGSGAGGGVVILSSQAAVSNWPAVYTAGGPGGLVTVPNAVATSGTCTSPPKATLGVTSGALSGTCAVVQAGAGCGTGTGVVWKVLGGGGTQGTATVNPTWSGGTLASCTVTPGTSSGYTAATYTTAGTGGDGGVGWSAEYAGW
jgi:hypothetical protein